MSLFRGRAVLLDGNVLVALSDEKHVHHAIARRWFLSLDLPFATCPITQGTLLRLMLVTGAVGKMTEAISVLRELVGHPRHRFWPDSLDYLQTDMKGVLGHKQVTDAYLASLARKHGGKLATFDQGLAALHPDVVELLE
ncbi:MAG: PIN domain-containing protein [Pseudoxanthomonas sp.]